MVSLADFYNCQLYLSSVRLGKNKTINPFTKWFCNCEYRRHKKIPANVY